MVGWEAGEAVGVVDGGMDGYTDGEVVGLELAGN
jgi:hypothetical protein